MHNILETEMGAKDHQQDNEKTGQKKDEEDDVDCPDTKIWIWDGDQYEEFQSDFLNQIFPFKLNKRTMSVGTQFIFHFLNSSLHYWVELVQKQQQQEGKLGIKDIKFIEEMLKQDESDNCIAFRRWGQQFHKKESFLEQEIKEKSYQHPKGSLLHTYQRGNDEFEIVEYMGDNQQFVEFKKRFQVLFLFYIDGVSFIEEEVDTWVYYVIFKKVPNSTRKIFVGALSKYVFRLSSVKERHRISQVFIVPTYQKNGHGKEILDLVYNISLKDVNCFEITTQIPSFQYQCLRDFKECQLILKENLFDLKSFTIMKTKQQISENRASLLTKENVRHVKEKLKLPGHQIERLTNILLYAEISKQGDDMAKAHFEEELRQKIICNRSPFKTRNKWPHVTLYGESPSLQDFLLEKAKEDMLRNQEEVQEILTQTLEGYRKVIAKLIKVKLLQS